MLDLHYWPTPNGHKIVIFLEETGLEYQIKPVNIGKGDQFRKAYLAISPNNKMPALLDPAPFNSEQPLTLFESGAILQYLAEKTGKYLPSDPHARWNVLQWLTWQVASQGPLLGQNHHFNFYAPDPIPYAQERYTNEATRLYNVLNRQLEGRDFICDDYSIADMAAYPWVVPWKRQKQDLDDFPNVRAWFNRLGERPAVCRTYALGKSISDSGAPITPEQRAILFGQTDCQPID